MLDSYQNYIDSDKIYQKYYAFSDNPPCDEDEFREKQFQSLIDRINRVPFDSEAADRGTCFGEIIDCMIENRKSSIMEISKAYHDDGKLYGIKAVYNNRTFTFHIDLCREFANYYKGALTQQRVEAILPTAYGSVLVYGLIAELKPTSVHDIKTPGSYTVGKIKAHPQH